MQSLHLSTSAADSGRIGHDILSCEKVTRTTRAVTIPREKTGALLKITTQSPTLILSIYHLPMGHRTRPHLAWRRPLA